MLHYLYNWTMNLAAHPHALLALGAISFIESSLFPIPPDVLLIPMILTARDKAFQYALFCTIASVTGGMMGYGIGYFLFEQIGHPVLEFYGYISKFEIFQAQYNTWGAWTVFIAGITPFPYKVITILSGVTGLDFMVFSISSVAARGIRFFIVAGLLWWIGPPIRNFMEKHLGLTFTVFVIMLVGGMIAIKFLR